MWAQVLGLRLASPAVGRVCPLRTQCLGIRSQVLSSLMQTGSEEEGWCTGFNQESMERIPRNCSRSTLYLHASISASKPIP